MSTNNNKPKKKLVDQKTEVQISESRIESPYTVDDIEKKYTINDLIDVWCRGCTNGATLWQYCQDKEYTLPTSFEAGLVELVNEVRSSQDKAQALQAMISNNMILLGVFGELH